MEASYFLFNNSSDDTLDILKQFLPEIEQELRQQIEPALVEQFALLTSRELQNIQDQGELEYQQALETLQHEFQHLKEEKNKELRTQLLQLEEKIKEHDLRKTILAQQKFLEENFDSKILAHQKMQEISEEMENQIGKALLEKYSAVREKKTKELRIRLESREQRERSEVDKAIKNEIYQKSGLEELRQEVKEFRISLASEKSKYNLKINKINKQIQDLNSKCQEKQYKNADRIIEELELQIEALNKKVEIQNESFGQDIKWQNVKEEKTEDQISKHKVFSLINQPFANYPETQYLQEDIDLDSENSALSQQSSSKQQDQSEPEIPMPPEKSHLLTHLLSSDYQAQEPPQSQQIYLQMPKQPLLRFNISKMLRDQWQQDDLDRYLYGSASQKQNKNVSNIVPTSNFSTLYKEHLQKLNQGSKPKLRKLSEKAKQQFMFNLSSQCQKRQQCMINL